VGSNPKTLFFCHFFFFILNLFSLLGTKSAGSASSGIKKTPITDQPAPGKKTSTEVPLVRDQPHTSHEKWEIKLRLKGRNEKMK